MKEKNIPLALSVLLSSIGNTGSYSLQQLKQLEEDGNEVLCHELNEAAVGTAYTNGTLDEELKNASEQMIANGFSSKVYVYPSGNITADYNEIKEITKKYFNYGMNVNLGKTYCDVNEYAKTEGFWNTCPLVDKMNIARMPIETGHMDQSWYVLKIEQAIKENGYLCLYMHSYLDNFSLEELKKVVNHIISLKHNVKFMTPTKAMEYIESL